MFSVKNLIVVVVALYLMIYVLKDDTQKMLVGGSAILFLCMGDRLLEGLEDGESDGGFTEEKSDTGDSIVGNRTVVKVAKNKLAPPFQKVEFDILYGQGISYEGDLIDKAIESGAIIQSGSWFSYKEDKIAQGKENLRQKLKEDDKLKKSIQSDVKGYLGL